MEHHSSRRFIITCEHSSNQVPAGYEYLFEQFTDVLNTHKGWDPGALVLATILSEKLGAPLFTYPWTRLLIEPNRSVGNNQLYSKASSVYPNKEKLVKQFYLPYRNSVEKKISEIVNSKQQVVHLSVHTFTPLFENKTRDFDIGLLYDPKRNPEKSFCNNLRNILKKEFQVKMNQPYKGNADGFTTYLRKKFTDDYYLGIELEVNQALYFKGEINWKKVCDNISASVEFIFNSTDQ